MTNHPLVRFGDVAREVSESCREPLEAGFEYYVGLEHLDPETLKLRRWGGIAEDEPTFTKVFRSGQMLFGRRRAYQRKAVLAEFDGICSGDIIVMEARSEVLLPDLLPFIVQSEGFYDHALMTSRGSLSPRTRWQDLARYEFPLPPLDEQSRLADLLWAAEDAIEAWRGAQSEVELILDSTAIFRARMGTETTDVEIDEIADVAYGITVNQARDSLPRRMPYLRVANAGRGYLDLTEVKSIGVLEEEIDKYLLQTGDLLLVEGHADADELGRVALWNNEIDNCLHQNHLIRIRCKRGIIPSFLCHYLNGAQGRSYFRRMAQNTSGLNTINSTTVRRFRINLPDETTQVRIADQIDMVVEARLKIGSHLLSIQKLKSALTAQIFAQ